MDTDKTIRETIAALDAEEQSITDEYQRLEIRLAQVRTAKAALQALENDAPVEFDGKLADAVRHVLTAVGQKSLAPTEIRDRVRAIGYDVAKHSNQMAAVHSVLRRLVESGEVKTKEWSGSPGQRRYYLTANFETTMNNSMDAANQAVQANYAHRQRAHTAAIQAATQGTYNPALHIETDKKK